VPRANVLLAHADERDLTQLDEYRAVGGYDALETANGLDSDALIEAIMISTLRGRGGAGFPTGRKASLVDRSGTRPSYLVVNADESEPGAFKDREIMRRNPHLLIEGCLIGARAILSEHVFIYIRGEYLTEWEVLQGAVDDARAAGLLGGVELTVHRGAGAYICGEETALLDSLEGRRGQPRPRPPFPPIQGLYLHVADADQQRADDRDDPGDHRDGRGGVREDRAGELAGHRDLLAFRQRRESRQLRARARLDAA